MYIILDASIIILNDSLYLTYPQTGGLSDVAPTILNIMGLPIPPAMTGHSLLE